MLTTAIVAFTTFFATIGPIDIAVMYAALTTRATPQARRIIAIRAVSIATGILLVFALLGGTILSGLGISIAALRTAGGILLLLIGIDMVFARQSGGISTTEDENLEATMKEDISVFPLAMPLIAGPGAMGASILLMADAESYLEKAVVVSMLLAVLLITFMTFSVASHIHRVLGVTGLHVIARVFGVLLAALAMQFIFDGLSQSGIFS